MCAPLAAGLAGLFLSSSSAPAPQLLTDTLVADINQGPAVVHGFGEGILGAGELAGTAQVLAPLAGPRRRTTSRSSAARSGSSRRSAAE